MESSEARATVIGLGHLGTSLAACLASKGLTVIGVDVDAGKVDAINQGRTPVFEPGVDQLIRNSGGRLTATLDLKAAVLASGITFVVVATPSEPKIGFSLKYVLPACEAIGRALRAKESYHLVVLTSTVMPGSSGGEVLSTLEKASEKRVGLDLGLCYSPEFIALGSIIHDFFNPDFVLIGESDPRSGSLLETLCKQVRENTPTVVRMNFINAEITKLSVNTFLTTKISFANMLARICEALPGAHVDVVTSALGLDTRIGAKFLKGAVSYGGPCFPGDNLALAALARKIGAPADIPEVIDHFNRSQVTWLAGVVQQNLSAGGAVGILGITYKLNTDVIENAFGLSLASELAERDVRVVVYDPAGVRNLKGALKNKVFLAESVQECIEQADVVVLAMPQQEFVQIPESRWARPSSPRTIIDCWRSMKHLHGVEGVHYLCLGVGCGFSSSSCGARC